MKERRISLPNGDSLRRIVYEGNYLTFEIDPERRYEIIKIGDSVAFLIYIRDEDKLVFVKQDRPPMISYENPGGTMLEIPAGRFDYDAGIYDLIINEAKEEAGIDLRKEDIEIINDGVPVAPSAGALTERRYLAYAEVDSSQVDFTTNIFGVHEEGEFIQRVLISVKTVAKGNIAFDTISSLTLVEWFLRNRYNLQEKNHECGFFSRILKGCCKRHK